MAEPTPRTHLMSDTVTLLEALTPLRAFEQYAGGASNGRGERTPTGSQYKTNSLKASIHDTRGSIFSNFETVKLCTEERMFLHAAKLGDATLLKDILETEEMNTKLNVNCVDYMGRNALFLAVDTEVIEAIEVLLERVSWECIEEALLHAISLSSRNIVRIIVDHPNYLVGEHEAKQCSGRVESETMWWSEDKYQFSPDITPLTLAAHMNDHELVQLFLSRGYNIDRPHPIDCQCPNCQVLQQSDSLKRSLSRLNAYKALASPAYMALSFPDPITATFELRQEMKKLAHVEKEFQNEYLDLVEQCMNFACELMDLCRGTQEVEAVLGDELSGTRDPLARLRLAIEYGEKKFVAHPSCQQHLTNIWFGNQMGFLLTLSWPKMIAMALLTLVLLPFLCCCYIINPNNKVGEILRCPVSKFVTHTISHFVFLCLLGLATFGLEDVLYGADTADPFGHKNDRLDDLMPTNMHSQLRPMRPSITNVQYIIMVWIIGLLWIECKQIYHAGAHDHFIQYYNFMDFSIIALYLASYALRFVARYRIDDADRYFNACARIREAIAQNDSSIYENLQQELYSAVNITRGYFIKASRFYWSPRDPEIVSDVLFAIANVMSFARTTYIMPFHELLGPLQISLGRMIGDIVRFCVLFTLVLVAFMVGMTNLYRYYGNHINEKTRDPASVTFKDLPETVFTLYFSIFGLVPLSSLKIATPTLADNYITEPSTVLVDRVGLFLFAIYLVVVSIVLVNILIAMMSHSFDAVQGDNDMEWKFARTKLWMNYIDENGTLPVPFNMIPTPKSATYWLTAMRDMFWWKEELKDIKYDFKRRRENVLLPDPETVSRILLQKGSTYSEIIQRLVRRYLFKQERTRKDERVAGVSDDFEQTAAGSEKQTTESEADNVSIVLDVIDEAEQSECPEADMELGGAEPSPTSLAPEYAISRGRKPGRASSLYNPGTVPSADTLSNDGTTVPRSVSAETLRQMTRRATIKRSATRRQSRRVKATPDTQLDAIQRQQKMLNARLQDLQTVRGDDSWLKETVAHMHNLLSMNQKAMGSLVMAMETIQDEIRNLAIHIGSGKVVRTHSCKSSSSVGGAATSKIRSNKSSLKSRRSGPLEC